MLKRELSIFINYWLELFGSPAAENLAVRSKMADPIILHFVVSSWFLLFLFIIRIIFSVLIILIFVWSVWVNVDMYVNRLLAVQFIVI